MYFNDMMFNPQYVNPDYYQQQARIMQYNYEQDCEVLKATNAMHDLCHAVKSMDNAHQQEAFLKCLAIMAEEWGGIIKSELFHLTKRKLFSKLELMKAYLQK